MATYEMETHSSKMARVHIFVNNVKEEGRLYDGDAAQLYTSLGAIGVGLNDINLHKDKKAGEIETIFKQMSKENYDTYNCVIIVFFGVGDYGVIQSNDKPLQLESVIRYLWADSCPSLAGKPKIFLNQACNDRRYFMVDGYDGPSDAPQRMPAQSDLLSAWSLLPVNLQKPEPANKKVGSLFFKYLCEELKKSKVAVKENTEKPWYFEEEDKIDFLKVLTHVSGLVAEDMPILHFEDSGHRNRKLLEHRIDDMPIPCTVSMLTKKLLFPVKV